MCHTQDNLMKFFFLNGLTPILSPDAEFVNIFKL